VLLCWATKKLSNLDLFSGCVSEYAKSKKLKANEQCMLMSFYEDNHAMNSNRRRDCFTDSGEVHDKVTADHRDAVGSGVSDAALSAPLSALADNDPYALTNVFENSKIKHFLYKVEPNIARINAPSLDLLSTTAALVLKKLIEKAVLQEQEETGNQANKKIRKDSLERGAEFFLLTSNHLKRAALNTSSLNFLEKTCSKLGDKDKNLIPSKLHEYVPRKKTRTAKREAASVSTKTKSTTLTQTNYFQGENTGNSESATKRLKRDHTCIAPSLFITSNGRNDSNVLDKTISNAANAEEKYVLDKIVEDDDDYD